MAKRMCCQYCDSTEVTRLYLATVGVDDCACRSCGAHWDERHRDGALLGRLVSAATAPAAA